MTLGTNELWLGDVIAVESRDYVGAAEVESVSTTNVPNLIAVGIRTLSGAAMTVMCSADETFEDPSDSEMVIWIRTVCARELGNSLDFPYFWASYNTPYEARFATADAELLRIFRAERPNHDTDRDAVLVMCHG